MKTFKNNNFYGWSKKKVPSNRIIFKPDYRAIVLIAEFQERYILKP